MNQLTRRKCLAAAGSGLLLPLAARRSRAEAKSETPIATNTYPWLTFARREERDFRIHNDQLLSDIAQTGIQGYEPIIESADEFNDLGQRLLDHGLEMKSIYVNSVLHDASKVNASIDNVISIATEARRLGAGIVVTNPSPIKWGGNENKDDSQLRRQAKSLDTLGAALSEMGMSLAYHNHDAELRRGGREFHHMLTATDPAYVKFCFDAHWVYRGCGNSQVAVFDALTHYHDRIVELHLRQSVDGVWSEAFSMGGDIDYTRLFQVLESERISPHFVLEQAVEDESPKTLTAVDAHRRSFRNLRKAFLTD